MQPKVTIKLKTREIVHTEKISSDENTVLKTLIFDAIFMFNFSFFSDEKMDNSPKFCSVTLRNISNGHLYSQDFRSESEIRVLHGNSEAHNCIKEVLTGVREDETGSGKDLAIEEGYSVLSNIKFRHFKFLPLCKCMLAQ